MSDVQTKWYLKLRKAGGGSYAVTVPPDAMKALGLEEGDILHVEVSGKKLVVEKA